MAFRVVKCRCRNPILRAPKCCWAFNQPAPISMLPGLDRRTLSQVAALTPARWVAHAWGRPYPPSADNPSKLALCDLYSSGSRSTNMVGCPIPNSAISPLRFSMAFPRLLPFLDVESRSAECSANANLLTQVSPLIVSITCQLRVLSFLMKPLIEIIKTLPNPSPTAIAGFLEAAAGLASCLGSFTPAGVLPFLRDLLCLEIRSLHCVLQNLRRILNVSTGDPAAIAPSTIQSVLDSYAPIVGVLDLASSLFGVAGVTIPTAPTLAGGVDLASLNADQIVVADYITALQAVVDALGGCQ